MAMKTDLKKTLDGYRARRGEFRILEMPPLPYLMVEGRGDPNTAEEYADALAALYRVAYTLKFASKRDGRDYVVPPLEALWWAENMDAFTRTRDKSRWEWTAMIMTPEWITAPMFEHAIEKVDAANERPGSLDRVRWEKLSEGSCVQTLHIGPYDEEGPVLEEMHDRFIPGHGLRMSGKHHEIYLGDPRRVEPSKLRTILRQPVVKA